MKCEICGDELSIVNKDGEIVFMSKERPEECFQLH